MTTLSRRQFNLAGLATMGAAMGMACPVLAQQVKVLKIGYQKTGLPVIGQQLKTIETALKPLGVSVQWVEFSAGPPLVEALNVNAIQLGWTGDAPPIFGQAAGSAISYIAAFPPSGKGEAIFTKSTSGITKVADLKGKKVAFGKGTSSNNLVVAALEANGLKYSDIEPVYLSPADAGAAFASDKVDAWAIWDPFFAIAELRYKPTVLVHTEDVLKVNSYFLANSAFPKDNEEIIFKTLDALKEANSWADQHRDQVAQALHDVTGVPLEAQKLAASRQDFGL